MAKKKPANVQPLEQPQVDSGKVKMSFTEHKYYNDLNNPLYLAGEVYEIEDNMVERWLKRGGKIVSGEIKLAKQDEPNPSKIVQADVKPLEQIVENLEPVEVQFEQVQSEDL